MDALEEYNRKRRFDQTGEPAGKTVPVRPRQLRFVVQHHIASRDHYDFRLEWDGTLKSWAVPKGPSYNSHDKRLAVQVEDHPLEYRNFEGTIPRGQYGGGTVMIWDEGIWQPMLDPAKAFDAGSLKFTLEGSRLKGKWALVRMKPKPGERDRNWLLIKEKDRFENAYDIGQFTTSIRTGRTMPEIGASNKMERKETNGTPPGNKKRAAGAFAANKKNIFENVRITHPEKILYQEDGITKGDIMQYYFKAAKRMLPYVKNRILSTVRCPGGIERACFFKKHPVNERGIFTVSLTGNDGKPEEYYYVTDRKGLLSEVQMNTLEFHTWGSRVETLEKPDTMVFDLDPDEGLDLGKTRRGVRDLKSLLEQLGLKAYLKTSGGKGYHIVIPFRPVADWTAFHSFARRTAKAMEAMWPDRYTSNIRKEQRKGRIFIDWIRNGRGATSVAPYSVRARKGAPVSIPIFWEELDTVAPNGITIESAAERLEREDPWKDFFENDQQLK